MNIAEMLVGTLKPVIGHLAKWGMMVTLQFPDYVLEHWCSLNPKAWYHFPLLIVASIVVIGLLCAVIKGVNLVIDDAPGLNWIWILCTVNGVGCVLVSMFKKEYEDIALLVSVGLLCVGFLWALCVALKHWSTGIRKFGVFLMAVAFVIETYTLGLASAATLTGLFALILMLLFFRIVYWLTIEHCDTSGSRPLPRISIPASNSGSDNWGTRPEKYYKDQNGEIYHGDGFGEPSTLERDTLGHHGTFDRNQDGVYVERYTGEVAGKIED